MTYLYLSIHTLTKLKRQKYRIRVRATDRGIPKLSADVDVELDVVDRNNRPPIWDQPAVGAPISPIYVKENAPQGHIVTTVRARFVHKNATKKLISGIIKHFSNVVDDEKHVLFLICFDLTKITSNIIKVVRISNEILL